MVSPLPAAVTSLLLLTMRQVAAPAGQWHRCPARLLPLHLSQVCGHKLLRFRLTSDQQQQRSAAASTPVQCNPCVAHKLHYLHVMGRR